MHDLFKCVYVSVGFRLSLATSPSKSIPKHTLKIGSKSYTMCHFTQDLYIQNPLTQPNLLWSFEKFVNSSFKVLCFSVNVHPRLFSVRERERQQKKKKKKKRKKNAIRQHVGYVNLSTFFIIKKSLINRIIRVICPKFGQPIIPKLGQGFRN